MQDEADSPADHSAVYPDELQVATDMGLKRIGECSRVPVADRVRDERRDIIAMSPREFADHRAQAAIECRAQFILIEEVAG